METIREEPDIIESVEMTIEAEESLNEIILGLSKDFRMKITSDGGASIKHDKYALIVWGSGKKYGAKNVSTGEKVFFEEHEKKKCREFLLGCIGATEERPVVLKLKKGLDNKGIDSFIRETFVFLKKNGESIQSLIVTTEEWDKNIIPYPLIPAAKKLFRRYAERGLMASLAMNGFSQEAKEFFCVAYIKGKVVDGEQIKFANIDQAFYVQEMVKSAKALYSVIPDKYIAELSELAEEETIYE